MQKTLVAAILGLTLISLSLPLQAKPDPQQSVIKVAILLDTSNSMDGLITQAKNQLWKIVNELSKAELNGRTPRLQVGLYEYGNDGLSIKNDYIRQVLPFTGDLDRVSEELFRLKTNGGEEYCGAVISDSLKKLDWSGSAKDMRAIFIAGNEPFDQGNISYKEACASARQKGIVVNTIFCGNRGEGSRSKWEDGAQIAGGRFLVIDQDQRVADISTPYDKELTQLGQQINATYVRYGPAGVTGAERQARMDHEAVQAAPSVAANRATSKATSNYSNSNWDVVDAKKDGLKVKPEQLPAEMQKMTTAQQEAYITKKRLEREKIQKRIQELSNQRQAYIAKNQKAQSKDSLDSALLKTIRVQAESKGYKFKK